MHLLSKINFVRDPLHTQSSIYYIEYKQMCISFNVLLQIDLLNPDFLNKFPHNS